MNELQEILARLEKLTPEEQEAVRAHAQQCIARRFEQRKKELWGNVIAAMQKYEAEIETITFMCHGGDYTSWYVEEGPGFIEIDS